MSAMKEQMIDAGWMQCGEHWVVPEGWNDEGMVVNFSQARAMFLEEQEHAKMEADYVRRHGRAGAMGKTTTGWDDWN